MKLDKDICLSTLLSINPNDIRHADCDWYIDKLLKRLSDDEKYEISKNATSYYVSHPRVDRVKIQEVGQKIYDAKIPLVSGVRGMHQLYVRFKERMPMYGPELSRIWDGIGDWAD